METSFLLRLALVRLIWMIQLVSASTAVAAKPANLSRQVGCTITGVSRFKLGHPAAKGGGKRG